MGFPGGASGKESTCQCKRHKRCRFKKKKIEMQVQSLGREDPLEKEMATRSSILAWRIPMDRGAWRATVHGVEESDLTEAT